MWCPSWSYAKDITVLAFGDSLIAGYGLPETDQFCAQLEIFLKEEGELVSVVNAGVSGDTSMAGFSRLEWSLASNPDAVILELGANDGLRGLDPAVTRMNLKKILQQLKRIGTPVLFAGMLAPPNLGKEYGKEFNAVFSELASEYDVIFYPFFLDGVAGRPRLNQSDGIHPNREGVREIIKRIIPYVRKLLTQVKQN
ncbi:MAG: arylesterase [Rhodospirillaceae bacterium]|nr:arylesterase [Rhodospirillaceae bacterium]|tara:strand:- start:1500 stop:2090 length:591 start_codon:yes stop_codon:yes gene_type:complete